MNFYERKKLLVELIIAGRSYSDIKKLTGFCNSTISKYKKEIIVEKDTK